MLHQDISLNITDSLITADCNASEIIGKIYDYNFDSTLFSEIINNVQWLDWIPKTLSLFNSINDRLIIKKITRFLVCLDSLSSKKKIKMSDRLRKDSKYREKIGNKLIYIIESINDIYKCDIIALLFDHYITEDISLHDFDRLSQQVQQASIADLSTLLPGKQINYNGLLNSGISRISRYVKFNPTHAEAEIEFGLELSKNGSLLQKIICNRFRNEKANNMKMMEHIFST